MSAFGATRSTTGDTNSPDRYVCVGWPASSVDTVPLGAILLVIPWLVLSLGAFLLWAGFVATGEFW